MRRRLLEASIVSTDATQYVSFMFERESDGRLFEVGCAVHRGASPECLAKQLNTVAERVLLLRGINGG